MMPTSSPSPLPPCLMNLPPANLTAFLARLRWIKTARPEQLTPPGAWRVWLVMAGRGWGKTRTGAEDLAAYALWHPESHLGVIAPTFADARDVCVEGPSGLLRVIPKECLKTWRRSSGDMVLKNGSRIRLFSADQPDRLRGPQHHRVWCDEVGAWPTRAAFDQASFGLRLGDDPRIVVTTTPRPTPLMRELVESAESTDKDEVILTRGRTTDNAAHLSARVLQALQDRYGGTRLGRQELEAEMLEDANGALWSERALALCRVDAAPALERTVVAVDPALSSNAGSDETGLVVAGRGKDGFFYVLADASGKFTPEGWATRAVSLARTHDAERIVAEVNAGGDLVGRLVRQHAPEVPFKPVRAVRGKAERALPIAALYEQGRVRHVGTLDRLEEQMTRITTAGLSGPGSPDRVDALVWALTDLSAPRSEPRVRVL